MLLKTSINETIKTSLLWAIFIVLKYNWCAVKAVFENGFRRERLDTGLLSVRFRAIFKNHSIENVILWTFLYPGAIDYLQISVWNEQSKKYSG